MHQSYLRYVLSIAIFTMPFATLNSYALPAVVIGIQGGYAKSNTNLKDFTEDVLDEGNFYYGATLGLDFDIGNIDDFLLGIETGVFYGNNFSKIHEGDKTIEVSNLIVPILGKIEFDTTVGINVFGKAGISYIKPSASKTGDEFKVDWKRDWSPTVALGLGYDIGMFNIFGQYMHIFGSDEVTKNGDGNASKIDAITIGFNIVF